MINVKVGSTPVISRHKNSGQDYLYYSGGESVEVEDSVDSLIKVLTNIKESYPEYSKMSVAAQQDCECRHDCSCRPSYLVFGWREPTELETKFKGEQAAIAELKQKKKDLEEYNRLRTKLEQYERDN